LALRSRLAVAIADYYLNAERQVDDLKSAFAAYFQHYDVLLCPVIPFTVPSPGLGECIVNGERVPSSHMMRATAPFNLTGLPGLSVPFSLSSEKLPINAQLVSKWFDEATILGLGQLIESATDAHNLHPIQASRQPTGSMSGVGVEVEGCAVNSGLPERKRRRRPEIPRLVSLGLSLMRWLVAGSQERSAKPPLCS
jgi:hypothetical protein